MLKLNEQIGELENLRKKLKEAGKVVNKMLGELGKLEEKIAEKEEYAEKVGKTKEDLAESVKTYQRLSRELTEAKKELEILEKTTEYLGKLAEDQEVQSKLPELKKAEKRLKKLRKDRKSLKKREDKLKAIQKQAFNMSKEFGEELTQLSSQLVVSKEVYSKLAIAEKEYSLLRDVSADLNRARESSKTVCFSSFINNAEAISVGLGECWRALYVGQENISALEKVEDAKLYVAPREKDGELEYEISVRILAPDKKTYEDFRGFASAGQSVVGSIAFRLALLSSIGGKIFVLDEPTIWVDSRRREYLSKVLRQVVEAIEVEIPIEQVILVTHDDSLLQYISPYATVYRCTKDEKGYCVVKRE